MDWTSLLSGFLGGASILAMKHLLERRSQKLQDDAQAIRDAERRLAEIRTPLYRELLRPWLMGLVAAEKGEDPTEAMAMADSADYYRTLVEFTATASDDLILAFNQMTKAGFLVSHFPEHVDPTTVPSSLGDFMLAIREELGPPNTKLTRDDLLRVRSPYWGNPDFSDVLVIPDQSSQEEESADM